MNPWDKEPNHLEYIISKHLILVVNTDGKKKKTKKPLNYKCCIKRDPETGCLSCIIKFDLPFVYNIKLDDTLKYGLTKKRKRTFNMQMKIPKRDDMSYTVGFSCDRLGQDYWPISDTYQDMLKLDKGLYKGIEFVKAECEKLIEYLHNMIQDRWEFIQY